MTTSEALKGVVAMAHAWACETYIHLDEYPPEVVEEFERVNEIEKFIDSLNPSRASFSSSSQSGPTVQDQEGSFRHLELP